MDENPTTGQPTGAEGLPETERERRLPEKLSQLRQKLGQKAKQEPKFRFYVLYMTGSIGATRWRRPGNGCEPIAVRPAWMA